MTNQLEIQHIAPYLPYGLRVQYADKEDNTSILNVLGFHNNGHVCYENNTEPEFDWIDLSVCHKLKDRVNGYLFIPIQRCKPLLLPMTALTEPLEDGSVPIVELAKKTLSHWFILDQNGFEFEIMGDTVEIKVNYEGKPVRVLFSFENDSFQLYNSTYSQFKTVMRQVELFDYLHAHFFDYRNLIGCGLAIDLREVKK